MGTGSELMGPSKLAERIVAFFLPPTRREEVLGDLFERYRSPLQYAWEAVRVVVCVMFSKGSRQGEGTMSVKTLAAIVAAFVCGLTIGIATHFNRNPNAHFFPDGLPFLVLLSLWAVFMAIKLTRPKPKC
jgi:hypothetical protein